MHNVAYVLGTASTTIGIFPSFSPINKQTKVGQQGNDKQCKAPKRFKEVQQMYIELRINYNKCAGEVGLVSAGTTMKRAALCNTFE